MNADQEELKFMEDFVDRNPNDPSENIKNFFQRTKGDTNEVERTKMRIEATRGLEDDPAGQEKVVVYFVDGKIDTAVIGKLEDESKKIPNLSRVILVSKDRTANTQKQIQLINHDEDNHLYMEHFRERELMIDITAHKLVPPHQVLTPAEKEELLARYKINTYQLPKIRQEDPVARYFGLMPGQVVKITRPSETAGRYVTYRVCVVNTIE
jgi:DNA-directed RNA polymerase I, II, and III subunit RPABC1